MEKCTKSRSWLITVVIAVSVVGLATLFIRCGSNPNFWFDESGQFWMSLGQIHYSPPLSPAGTLQDVLRANRTANMDPGGYTVALHYWIGAGTSPGWLRSFSFLFFVGTMLAFAKICHLWTGNRLLSALAGLSPLALPLLTRYALELRPYSMEACGVAVSLLLLEYCARRQTVTAYFTLGCVVALFLTSRYSFIFTATAIGLGVLWQVRNPGQKSRVARVAAYAVPVLAMCGAIYLVTLGNPGSHQKADPGPYVQDFIMHGKTIGQQLSIAAHGLFSPYGLGGVVLLSLYLVFLIRRTNSAQYQLFTSLVVVVAAMYAQFLFCSLIGMYPWCPQARWGITLTTVSLLSWFAVCWMAVGAAGLLEGRGGAKLWAATAVACAIAALYNVSTSTLYTTDTIYANLLALGPEKLRGKYIFVAAPAQASLRYLYECGPLQRSAQGIYPQSFRFELPANFSETLRPFDYLISPDEIRKGEFSGG